MWVANSPGNTADRARQETRGVEKQESRPAEKKELLAATDVIAAEQFLRKPAQRRASALILYFIDIITRLASRVARFFVNRSCFFLKTPPSSHATKGPELGIASSPLLASISAD